MSSTIRDAEKQFLLSLLPQAQSTDDKYSRGVLGLVTGSKRFPGAALLGATAALRSGIGMARIASDPEVLSLLLEARPECVPVDLEGGQLPNVDAWVIGSGIAADDSQAGSRINLAVSSAHKSHQVCVVDAGALDLIDSASFGPKQVLTPHAGEAVRLLARFGIEVTRTEIEHDTIGAAEQIANLTGAIVVLKGNRTVVAGSGGRNWRNHAAPAELATAGTGDVLAALVGALAAKNSNTDPFEIARAAVVLHTLAAEELAEKGDFLALELANQIRETILRLRTNG